MLLIHAGARNLRAALRVRLNHSRIAGSILYHTVEMSTGFGVTSRASGLTAISQLFRLTHLMQISQSAPKRPWPRLHLLREAHLLQFPNNTVIVIPINRHFV